MSGIIGQRGTNRSGIMGPTADAQPAFYVRPNAHDTDNNASSAIDIAWQTETFDQGSNFSTPSFTAPVAGKYQFNFMIHLQDIDNAATDIVINLVASNGTVEYRYTIDDFGASADIDDWSPTGSMLVDMDASDTCKITVAQTGGSTSILDIHTDSRFSGYLVC